MIINFIKFLEDDQVKELQINKFDLVPRVSNCNGTLNDYLVSSKKYRYSFCYKTNDSYETIQKEVNNSDILIYPTNSDNAFVVEYVIYTKPMMSDKARMLLFLSENFGVKKVYKVFIPIGNSF